MDAVLGVPGGVLQALVDGAPGGDEGRVDRLDALAGHEAERRIARGGDEVKAALVHQGDHFVAGVGGLDVDLAARGLFKAGGPVVGLVGFAAFDVACPGNDVELSLTLANGLGRGCEAGGGGGSRQQTNEKCAGLGHRNS